jgi:hypothetical protein
MPVNCYLMRRLTGYLMDILMSKCYDKIMTYSFILFSFT